MQYAVRATGRTPSAAVACAVVSLAAGWFVSGPATAATYSGGEEARSAQPLKIDVLHPPEGAAKAYPVVSGVRDASFYGPGYVSDAFSIGPRELPSALRATAKTARPGPICDIACKGLEAGLGAGLRMDRAVFTTLFPTAPQAPRAEE